MKPGDRVWHRREDSNYREEIHSVNADGTVNINAHEVETGEIIGGHIAIFEPEPTKVNGRCWPR